MASVKVLIGQFIKRRQNDPDDPGDLYAPGGVVVAGKSFLDIDLADYPPVNPPRRDLPPMPAPKLDKPSEPWEPRNVGDFERTSPAGRQPDPVITPARPPAGPIPVPDPPTTSPAPFTGAPTLPGVSPPAGPINVPDPPATQPASQQPLQGPLTSPTLPSPDVGHTPDPIPVRPTDAMTPAGVKAIIDARSQNPLSDGGQIDPRRDLLGRLDMIDASVKSFLNQITAGGDPLGLDPTKGPYTQITSPTGPGMQGWNPRLFAAQVVRLGKHLGPAGIAKHAATQTFLFSLNRHGRFWNPATLNPPPGMIDFIPAQADVLTGGSSPHDVLPGGPVGSPGGFYERNEIATDTHFQLSRGQYNEVAGVAGPPFVAVAANVGRVGPHNLLNHQSPRLVGAKSQDSSLVDNPVFDPFFNGRPMVEAALEGRNIYNPESPHKDGQPYNLRELYRAAIDESSEDKDLLTRDGEAGLKRFGTTKLFTATPVTLKSVIPIEYRPKPRLVQSRNGFNRLADPVKKSFFPKGVVPARFDEENEQGFLQHRRDQNPSDKVSDDDAYVPLSFTDLRPYGDSRLRTVYFRPFITNMSEDFQPMWDMSNGMGRVDPIKSYKSTTRQLALGFIVHAFSPEDLAMIYKKLTWLQSMVYPEYDKDMLYRSGPVVRVRVGDVISSHSPGGLAGTIDSLSIDYSDQIWELEKDSKVPMGYKVALNMTVLHDVPIGRGIDGKFGGLGSIAADGRYRPPRAVTSDAGDLDSANRGPEVKHALDIRGFSRANSTINDYDPNE